jgi:hypothetical protein
MLTLPRRAPDTGHSGHTVANMTRAGRERHPALAGKVSSAMPYDDTYPEGSVHVGLPSTSITMIVAFDDALDVGWLRSPEHATYWTSASGLHTEPAVIRTHGHQHGIQLELTPVGARALLGLHAGELAATTTDTERLPLGLTGSEHAWIAEGASDGVRLHRLEQALASRLGHRCGKAPHRSRRPGGCWGRPGAEPASTTSPGTWDGAGGRCCEGSPRSSACRPRGLPACSGSSARAAC